MLKHRIQALLIIVTVLVQSCRKNEIPDIPDLPEGDFKVIAYVPGWGDIDFSAIQAEKLTHVNYAFINVKDGKVYSEMEQDSVILGELVGLKSVNPDLDILVSVGGWGWSTYFSDVALTDSSRNIFSESVIEFIKKYWDDKALAPYLWCNKYGVFITYDDTESIRYKTEYIRKKGIGGIMFWEYSQDYNGYLLNTITQGFE